MKKYRWIFLWVFAAIFWTACWHYAFTRTGGRDNLTELCISIAFALPLLAAIVMLSKTQCLAFRIAGIAGIALRFVTSVFAGCIGVGVWYCIDTGDYFRGDLFGAFLQSNPREMIEYFSGEFYSSAFPISFIATFLLSFVFLSVCSRLVRPFSLSRRASGIIVACCLAISVVSFFQVRFIGAYFHYKESYIKAVEEFKEVSRIIGDAEPFHAEKQGTGELFVLIMGESASRDRMQVYGGAACNTPWMQKVQNDPGWLFYQNAYACHTHTVQALSAALGQGNQYTGLTFPHTPTIVSVSRAADMQTAWISNQTHTSLWDNAVSAIADTADATLFVNGTKGEQTQHIPPDEILLPAVENYLKNRDATKNTLLIIHLIGSHSKYAFRYPRGFKELSEYASTGYIGRATKNERNVKLLTTYETSILYTDTVLEQLFEKVREYSQGPTAFLYLSDHGSDPEEKKGHDSQRFTWAMGHIPLTIWLSPEYRETYPERAAALYGSQEKVFTNDLLFDLYVGMAGIRFENQNFLYDLASPEYLLNKDNAIVLHGKWAVKDDPVFTIRENFSLDKLAVHRVNTVYKAHEAWALGARRIETDVSYREVAGKRRLIVGHDEKKLTGMPLETFLGKKAVEDMSFIWLDMKDLTSETARDILAELEEMDARFSLKTRVLIETSSPLAAQPLSAAGWKVSYYLPWDALMKSEAKDAAALAEKIATDVRENNIAAISYDLQADKRVTALLVELLPDNTQRHAWTTAWRFDDPMLAEKIAPYSHLDSLLIKFSSRFHM